MSTSFILNYRKSKESYSPSDELIINLRYYSNGINDGRLLNISTGVKCKIKDWKTNYKKTTQKEPIKKTDKDYKKKNLILKQKESELITIISQINWDDKIPTVDLVKSLIRKGNNQKKVNSTVEIHFLVLFDLFHKYKNSLSILTENTKRTINGSINDIKRFTKEYQNKNKINLLVSDIDDEWMWEFIKDCDERGLQSSTIKKRFSVLSEFGKWCNKEHKVMYFISPPKNFRVKTEKEIIFLNREEVNKLIDFNGFEIDNSEHKKLLTYNHQEIEYIVDKVETKRNNGIVKYTSFEVYKDMLLFLCGTGMRFGDMVRLRIDDYEFRDGNRTEGSFSFIMEKTSRKVVIPIEGYVHQIWKKYSRGKKYRQGYFVFPRTKFGNPISNQKFNQHIKEICEIVGLKRWVRKPKYNLQGKVIIGSDEQVPLYDLVSSHIGRRTFIREHIEIGTPPRKIMKMTGHSSQDVFDGYYEILNKDVHGINRKIYQITTTEELKVNSNSEKTKVEEELLKLKSLFDKGLIPEKLYLEKVSNLI